MTNKKRQPQESKLWTKATWKGFVNVKLGKEEKQQIKENLLTEETGFEFLMNAATDGYKCSISYSIPEEVYTVSLTGVYLEKPNSGITMSIRHVDLVTCLSALQWCHEMAGKSGDWSERFTLSGNDDW